MKKPDIHVMHVLGGFGPGGAEMGVVRLIRAMQTDRFSHSVCSISSDLGMKALLPENVPCHSLYLDGPSLWAFKKLAKLFRKNSVDIVHVNNLGPWFDCALGSRLAGCRCIQTFHGVEDISMKFSRLKKLQIYIAWKSGHHLGAVSDASAALFSELTGIDKSHIHVIDNAVDTDLFCPVNPAQKKLLRQKLGLPQDFFLIGCVAALRPVKNHAGLITAFSELVKKRADSALVLVGDGPLQEQLKNHAGNHGIAEKIIFTGRKNNIDEYLKSFDMAALNSETEGLSYAVLEAMSCSVPMAATDVGGNSLIIEDGKDGFLYPRGDTKALIRILIRAFDNQDMIKEAGKKARKKIIDSYSLDFMVHKYSQLYSGLK